ncbi:peptidoglycan/LPS O-acetylase OafA/YrhL [Sphingobium sp. B8D3A]|nr:peptidoglycan/LPS O-acetylase OafA/YrhL [Sphingobium sp. B8D3A]
MFIAWWTGKGYMTMVIVLLTMIVFGFILQAGAPFLKDRTWYWGVSFILAAAINWAAGTRWNKRRIERTKPKHLGQRLWYPATNRFMSMPMETFSLVIALVGLALIVSGLASSAET